MAGVAAPPSLLARIRARVRNFPAIGPWSTRPGPLVGPWGGGQPRYTDEGWLLSSWPMNFGQLGYDPIRGGWNATVYACIMLYARTIAQLPGNHKRLEDDGGESVVKTSALARILKRPNDYQTRSDFLFNAVACWLHDGNAYALAIRNDRQEVAELHLLQPRSCRALIAETGDIFYQIGGNKIVDARFDVRSLTNETMIVPARDIMHLRAHCPDDVLVGVSPVKMVEWPIATSSLGAMSMATYFANMSKPSGVLSTDNTLTVEQVKQLRERWEEQSKGVHIGGVPILTSGLKWQDVGNFNANDAQVTEQMKQATAQIAAAFGVPLSLINDMTGATWNNTEHLIQLWLSQGLGYYLDRIELAYDKLFGIERADDFTEFDVRALLRPDFKTRIEGLARAVQGGVYSPNEARASEGLPRAKDGDEPRLQAQVVPLSAAAAAPAPSAPAAPAADAPDEAEEVEEPAKAAPKLSRVDSAFLTHARLRAMLENADA